MKENLFDFLDNYWALFWFFLGCFLFGMAIVRVDDETKVFAFLAFGCACHARCETKVIERRVERYHENQEGKEKKVEIASGSDAGKLA